MIKSGIIVTAAIGFFLGTLCIFPGKASCQDDFEKALNKKLDSLLKQESGTDANAVLLPNDAPQTLTTPSGFGGYGTYLFGAVGGAYPQQYHTSADLIASGGVSIGNPFKAINFAASLNMADVHRLRDFSGNFIVSRSVPNGSSISAGALQLFAPKLYSDAPGQTYYLAFSHAVQGLPSLTDGSSKLTYTIGLGNGRFYDKSPDDIAAGRGSHGTAVFGSVSYEVFQHVNMMAEWSGTNLGISTGFRPFENALSFGLGVGNLTRYSGDKPNLLFSVGYPLALTRRNE